MTELLLNRIAQLEPLRSREHPFSFRVSIDVPNPEAHDKNRGAGNFDLSLKVMGELHQMGFKVSIARQSEPNEDAETVNAAYAPQTLLWAEPAQNKVCPWQFYMKYSVNPG